jgi:hypothetical protein
MKLRLLCVSCVLSFTCFGQWTNLNTGIADNLNDIYFYSNELNGLVAGNQGVYYTTTGGNGAAAWTRFAPANATDLATYNRSKFLKIARDPGSFKTYICGIDTVNQKAVILYFKADDQAYSFIYTGPVNSALYDIRWTSNAVYAVGKSGLMVKYVLSNSSIVVYPALTTRSLRAIAFETFSNTNAVMGGDSIMIRAVFNTSTTSSVTSVPLNYNIRSINIEYQAVYAIGPSGYYKTISTALAGITELTTYRQAPLNATMIFQGLNSTDIYVTTDHGIYKKYIDPLEFQPSSAGLALNAISFSYGATTGYACGNNGLVVKSANGGGGTIPYNTAVISTACKGDFINIERPWGGSGNNCKMRVLNASNVEVYNVNTGCALSAWYGWNSAGNFTIQYIESNGSYSDTVFKSVYIPEPPVINLVTTINDSILCKNEKLMVGLAGTTTGWNYILRKQGSFASFGYAPGNGGSINFQSEFINETANYYIEVESQTNNCRKDFTNIIPVTVEHPKGRLASSLINANVNENVVFNAISNDAQNFKWTFDASATQQVFTGKTVQLSFNSLGAKDVSLISWSNNGCYDTSLLAATRVVSEAALSDDCFNLNFPGVDANYNLAYPFLPLQKDLKFVRDGFLLGGGGYQYIMRSRTGDSVSRTNYGGLYLAKYSLKGVLKWRWYSKHGDYNCATCYYTPKPAVENIDVRPDGSILFAGNHDKNAWLYFTNGDSIQIAAGADIYATGNNGFVAKADSIGSLLWRGVFKNGHVEKMKVDRFGNIWILVAVGNDLTYEKAGGSVVNIPLPANLDFYDDVNCLIKLSANGDYLSSAMFAHNGPNSHRVNEFITDDNGNIWLTGLLEMDMRFYNSNNTIGGTISRQAGTGISYSGFLVKYDNACNHLFNVNIAGLKTPGSLGSLRVFCSKLALDSLNNIYMLGMSNGLNSNTYMNMIHSDGTVATASLGGFFLAKFDQAGHLSWANGSRYADYYSDGHALSTTNNTVIITSGIKLNPGNPWTGVITSSDNNQYGITMNNSSFLIAEYDYNGKLEVLGHSQTAQGGGVKPYTIDKKNGRYYISGETDRGNGGGSSYLMFGQVLPSEGADGFFTVLNSSMCYAGSAPVANAGSDRTICSGAPTAVGSTPVSGNYYSWTSNPSGFVSASANPNVNPQVTTSYYLSVVNSSGIISADTVVVTIAGPVANAGPNRIICGAGTASIGSAAAPGIGYSWTSSPAGFTSSDAQPLVNPVTTTTYYLQAMDAGSCIGRDTVVVSVVALPVANAGPDRNICKGNYALLGAPGSATLGYSWSPTTALSFPNASETYGNPVQTTTYVLSVTNGSGCVKKDTVVVNVTIVPKPVITANGSTTICQGSSVTLNSSAGAAYQWYKDGSMITGATANSYTATAAGNYTVRHTAGGCQSDHSDTITVVTTPLPASPIISASGPVDFCQAANAVLTSSAASGNQWYKSGVAIPGATGTSYTATSAGSYRVTTTDNTCTSLPSQAIIVTEFNTPAAPVLTATGSTTVCQGYTVTLSVQDAGTFKWYKDGVEMAGQTASQITVNQSGNYTVAKVNLGCISSSSNAINVTVINNPAPVITAPGSYVICEGDSITLTSSASSGNQWYNNGNLIPGATGNTFTTKVAGNYSVRYTAGGCQSPFSIIKGVYVYPLPAAPVIVQAGSLLVSSAPVGNQWYLNGVLITGATSITYAPAVSGIYTVRSTQNGCTGPLSAGFNYIVTAVNSSILTRQLNIGPNPVHNKLFINYSGPSADFELILLDATGKKLNSAVYFKKTYTLSFDKFSAGVYVVEIRNKRTNEVARQLIVK